jgi:hypothetical protein
MRSKDNNEIAAVLAGWLNKTVAQGNCGIR